MINENDIQKEWLLEELENMGTNIVWDDLYIILRDDFNREEGKRHDGL